MRVNASMVTGGLTARVLRWSVLVKTFRRAQRPRPVGVNPAQSGRAPRSQGRVPPAAIRKFLGAAGAGSCAPRYTCLVPVPRRHPSRLALFAGVAMATLTLASCQSRTPAGDATPPPARTSAADTDFPLRMLPDEVRDYVAGHPEALMLDVRDSSEWNDDMGHIAGSKSIPLKALGGRIGEIGAWKDKPIIVISRVGDRGGAAVVALREAGFKQVTGLEGGLEAWRRAGL